MQTVIMGNVVLSCRAKKPSLSLLFLGNQADRRKRKDEEDEDKVSDFVRTKIPCSIFDFGLSSTDRDCQTACL